jgi:pimeloyl-ACP methyl ester carboxylesterase
MVRLLTLTLLLVCLVMPPSEGFAQSAKEVEINGVRLQYVEQGTGQPVVFVHGCSSDLRVWEPVRDKIAKKYRFVAYTQRYFGTAPWNDDGKKFSVATLADDLAKFITSLNAGPVHLVGWSFVGGVVAMTATVQNPSLIRSLVLYEAGFISVLRPEATERRAASTEQFEMFAPASAASRAGDPVKGTRLLMEALFQLPPGGSDREPQAWQAMWDENARTAPLFFTASPPPAIPCDMLKDYPQPMLVMRGEKTHMAFVLISEAISKCAPAAQQVVLPNVNHDGPIRDPSAFSAVVLEFLSNH